VALLAAVTAAGALGTAAASAPAAPGDLDPAFGGGSGFVALGGAVADAVAVQADGRIVAAGSVSLRTRFAVVRRLPDGAPDPGFGTGGMVITSFGAIFQAAYDVAVQRDGRIVAAGSAGEDSGRARRMAVARYLPDGRLDPGFGGDGLVTVDFGVEINDANALALGRDGSVVLAGYAPGAAGGAVAVARLRADGSLDPRFGGDGRTTLDFGGSGIGADVAVRPGGAVLVAGSGGGDFALARLRRDGTPDRRFGAGGIVHTDVGAADAAYALAVGSGGRATVLGPTSGPGLTRWALARHRRDGAVDPSFGGDGLVTTTFGVTEQIPETIALLPGGGVLAGGYARRPGTGDDVALVRYRRDGSLEPAFGTGGVVLTDIGAFNNQAHDLAVQRNGRIVVAAGLVLLRYLG
jgi:uncharacterized delta-60 repeat protein